jgi:triosephosphate isomerase
VRGALEGSSIGLAAQNVYPEDHGAFTGEVSAPLLKDAGCQYCIVGHSERRHIMGETNGTVHAKTKALLAHDMQPIICVGETLEEREAGNTLKTVLSQLAAALKDIDPSVASHAMVAYEPVWAIGTGRTASPSDAQSVHAAIRAQVEQTHGAALARSLRILYGGSVKPANAAELLAQPDIDGALVGGASLVAESFAAIVNAANQ